MSQTLNIGFKNKKKKTVFTKTFFVFSIPDKQTKIFSSDKLKNNESTLALVNDNNLNIVKIVPIKY